MFFSETSIHPIQNLTIQLFIGICTIAARLAKQIL